MARKGRAGAGRREISLRGRERVGPEEGEKELEEEEKGLGGRES